MAEIYCCDNRKIRCDYFIENNNEDLAIFLFEDILTCETITSRNSLIIKNNHKKNNIYYLYYFLSKYINFDYEFNENNILKLDNKS